MTVAGGLYLDAAELASTALPVVTAAGYFAANGLLSVLIVHSSFSFLQDPSERASSLPIRLSLERS